MSFSLFIKKYALIAALTVFALVCVLVPLLAKSQQSPQIAPHFDQDRLVIATSDGRKIPLSIEVARTDEQSAYGLMFRRSLPENSGMIFLNDHDRLSAMWMKNTYIPLDMLFVRRDGSIAKIIANAVPFDLTPLESDEPVRAVIELNGGAVARMGLKTGDKVVYPALSLNP